MPEHRDAITQLVREEEKKHIKNKEKEDEQKLDWDVELPIFEFYKDKAAVLKMINKGDPNISGMSENMFNTCFPSLSREQAKLIYQYWKDHKVVVNKFEGVRYDDLDFIWYDVRKLPLDDIIA